MYLLNYDWKQVDHEIRNVHDEVSRLNKTNKSSQYKIQVREIEITNEQEWKRRKNFETVLTIGGKLITKLRR